MTVADRDQPKVVYIEPHAGPQDDFVNCGADIAIYGGQAGGGKTWGLLATAAKWTDIPGYGAVIFRRECPQITNEGGMWDESMRLYPLLGGNPRVGTLDWRFGEANIGFRHLQREGDVLSWQGSQIAMIGFDELTHFTESQFWYLLSRNRSSCGVRPFVRATTNPMPEDDPVGGWVKRLISWWIGSDGYAISERSGVIRWFIRKNSEFHWADSREDMLARFPKSLPKSLTFIHARLSDNPTLLELDPDYLANLEALPEVDRLRLSEGNWNAKKQAGMFFKIGNLKPWPSTELPATGWRWCRAWDLAATDGAGDWTVGAKVGSGPDGQFMIADVVRGQWEGNYRDKMIRAISSADGLGVRVRFPQDPGSAGKTEASRLVGMVPGLMAAAQRVTGDKETRAVAFASQVNAGNVWIVPGDWNHGLMQRMDAFPMKGTADDEIDALSDAFDEVISAMDLGKMLDAGMF